MSPWHHFIGMIFVDMIKLRSYTSESIKAGVKDLSISYKILSRPAAFLFLIFEIIFLTSLYVIIGQGSDCLGFFYEFY